MYKILIVDDLTSDIKLVMECLKDDYQLSAATSGEKAIELAAENNPDLILMDVSMPSMNGYDACKHILRHQHANIIFLSANDRTDEILRGYDAGGIDYLIKPFKPDILREKIAYALKRDHSLVESSSSHYQATNLLKWLGESINQTKDISSQADIPHIFVNACKVLNLKVCIQCHSNLGVFEAGHQGSLSKLESEILTRQLQEEGNYFESAQGLFITFEAVALLVKNPPESFEELEHLREALTSLAEAANALLHQLDRSIATAQSEQQAQNNQAKCAELNALLDSMEEHIRHQSDKKQLNVKLIENVLAKVEESFVDLGLTYNQEKILLSILHAGIDQSVNQYELTLGEDQALLEKIHKAKCVIHL